MLYTSCAYTACIPPAMLTSLLSACLSTHYLGSLARLKAAGYLSVFANSYTFPGTANHQTPPPTHPYCKVIHAPYPIPQLTEPPSHLLPPLGSDMDSSCVALMTVPKLAWQQFVRAQTKPWDAKASTVSKLGRGFDSTNQNSSRDIPPHCSATHHHTCPSSARGSDDLHHLHPRPSWSV